MGAPRAADGLASREGYILNRRNTKAPICCGTDTPPLGNGVGKSCLRYPGYNSATARLGVEIELSMTRPDAVRVSQR